MTQNAQANLNNRQAAQLAALLRATGATLRAIADQLNQSGYRTRHGKAFHPMGVQRLLRQSSRPFTRDIIAIYIINSTSADSWRERLSLARG